ncbi:MAG TPA: hypothetical protein DHW02_09940 [Ktedonobacter sp.]|nr:hypothetical protein [Ktedonobacter sp.]
MTTIDQPLKSVDTLRFPPDGQTVLANLGLLQNLAGTWQGQGFNLIARPDFQDGANLFLQLNQTRETLHIQPIGSAIPNRGFGQDDIELFGLTYLDKISDLFTGSALHIEPGIWIKQPDTNSPLETAPQGSQLIARMATIPHGNAVLAQGLASPFSGPPTLKTPTDEYAFSVFPSFNSTPFGAALPPSSPVINAAGTSEKLNAAAIPAPPFNEYDLTIGVNSRTQPLPATINSVSMQDIVNDPIRLLQVVIENQVAQGHTFEGTVLNIATQQTLSFRTQPNQPHGASINVNVPNGSGGIENILFLEGTAPQGPNGPNALTAQVYATFWIEKVQSVNHAPFMQLQYAQMTVLNFPILKLLPTVVNLGWPHITVATLTKDFF